MITMRALERDAENRWQSADEMNNALKSLLAVENPTYGVRQLAQWVEEHFAQDMKQEQDRLNLLLEASKNPEVIEQRKRTIYKVMESIVKFQKDFLDKGIQFLKPLVLRDVAEDIQMHESTISRVTHNKYAHTPQGIYELKFFFNTGITSTEGETLASESVKNLLREIIAKEDPKKPYSDEKLVEILKTEKNIHIARRTISKYREMMKILSSNERRKIG
jgi:RNA polymerase sigma-54 factor